MVPYGIFYRDFTSCNYSVQNNTQENTNISRDSIPQQQQKNDNEPSMITPWHIMMVPYQ